jgi:predicted AlkP superfamily pyrophosphatase or phosphodiesterase
MQSISNRLGACSPSNALILTFAAVLLSAGSACSSASRTASAPRPSVILISVDGLRPEFYRSGSGWEAPTLQKLAAQGASAESAETIFPSVTYPSHSTIVTGVRSARHGVYSNTTFSMQNGPMPDWYFDVSSLKVPTVWQQAHQAGLKTAILTWPVSVGAQVDWLVPEIFPATPHSKESTWELILSHGDPGFLKDLDRHAGGQSIDGFAPHDTWVANVFDSFYSKHHPDFTLIHIIAVDHAEHEFGKDSAETHAAVKEADAVVGRILASVDLSKTTLVLLGDHGFYDYDKVIRPNVLFARQGWLKEEASSGREAKLAPDWKVATYPAAGAAAVYTRDPKLAPAIVRLLKKNARHAYRVIEREELDRLEAFPGAVCAIDPVISTGKSGPGYSVSLEAHGPFIEKKAKIRGNHGPMPASPQLKTGLLVVGPGVRPGTNLGQTRLLDVAPTIARLLNVSLPGAEGHAIEMRGE